MDKIKPILPLRPGALIRKQAPSRIVKFKGDPKMPGNFGKRTGIIQSLYELNKAICHTVFSVVQALFTDISRPKLPASNPDADKSPSRKATIIPIDTAYHE